MKRDKSKKHKLVSVARTILGTAVLLGMLLSPTVAFANDHGKGHGSGGGNSQGGGNGGGSSADAPEIPYAAILPVGLVGITFLVYRRKTKAQG